MHHVYTNTLGDPDRRFLASEACQITWWYSRIFYPNKQSSRWNLIVRLHFWPYIFRNTIAAFYPNQSKPILVPAKPAYTRQERLTVAEEIIAIIALQCVLFYLIGADFGRYVFASLVAMLITSSIVMSYIFTNHFLNALSMSGDPLANTTSVVVYEIFDWLHLNFSYHTEHHLFPGMNSDYYPEVSHLLMHYYGNRYNRIGFGDAWNRLWKLQLYASADLKSDVDAAPLSEA
jgi:fatty acid desaturase